jgi:cytidylate kinase
MFNDEKALVKLIRSDRWQVIMESETTRVTFDEMDVTREIFQESIGNIASQISKIPEVRKSLLVPQRDCASDREGLVAEGRDCGTVVFPDADIKVYLTADSEARASRRASEQGQSVEGIRKAQKERDHSDSTRSVAPMKVADDAIVLDTTELTLDQVVDKIEDIVRVKLSKTGSN